jgi:predicted pyridoxal phosphate-dependent acyltransferase
MNRNDFQKEIEEMKQEGLFRSLKTVESAQGPEVSINGKKILLLSSNNYLGLADHPVLKKAMIEAIQKYGVGSGASRLVSGNMTLHEVLEQKLAEFKEAEAALVFNSGYTANIGLIPCLARRSDVILADRLNHASLIDGCRLSNAVVHFYHHKKMDHLETLLKKHKSVHPIRHRMFIVTDGVFSMDGDLAPLPDIADLAERYSATVVLDDAHGTGVLGKHGKGTVEHFELKDSGNLIQMGTLSKAVGVFGAYVAGSRELISYLVNKARSFLYTTSLPPAVAAASIAALEIIQKEPELRAALWENQSYFVKGLKALGYHLPASETPIIPILVGETALAVRMAEALLNEGIYAPAIRPPTVPKGTSRIRLTVMATHTKAQLDFVLDVMEKIGQKLGILESVKQQ